MRTQAPFKKGSVYLFTATAEAGIEKYPQPLEELTVDKLVRYLDFKLSPVTDHQRSLVHVFKSEKKFKALTQYSDMQNVLMAELGTETLPTTIFFGADGKERWRVYGMMDWTGGPAKKLIDDAVGS